MIDHHRKTTSNPSFMKGASIHRSACQDPVSNLVSNLNIAELPALQLSWQRTHQPSVCMGDAEAASEKSSLNFEVDHVDYGKSCSIVWSRHLDHIMVYVNPRQLVSLGMVSQTWLGAVGAYKYIHERVLKSTFLSSFLPIFPPALTDKEVVKHVYEGAAELSLDESETKSVVLSLTVSQGKVLKEWKEDVAQAVELMVPKAFLPWDTVDEAALPEALQISFQYFGRYCLVTARNEIASRIGCSNCQMKFWKDELASEDEEIMDEVDSDYDSEDEVFVEYVIEGKEYDEYSGWKKKFASRRFNPDSALPPGTYSGAVNFHCSFDTDGGVKINYMVV